MTKEKMKTQKNNASVTAFLNSIEDEQRRKDAKKILEIMKDITGEKPFMWGTSIVGFGAYSYTRSTGEEYAWFQTGFSPRKQALSLYIMPGLYQYEEELKKLGPHKKGVSCLYIKQLEDIHLPTLKKIVRHSLKELAEHRT